MSAIAENWQATLSRVAHAAHAAHRDPAEILVMAVSKTFGPDDVIQAWRAGARCFGENYVQEGVDKVRTVGERLALTPGIGAARPQWHFIGPLQSNKSRLVAEHFDWVHSVDRLKIAQRLSEQRPPTRPDLQVCVQVNISNEHSKSGAPVDDVLALCRAVALLPRLRLRGLMAIPAPTTDAAQSHAPFAALRHLLERLRAAGLAVDTLSMGMSADLEAAVAEGATIVRVGTAIFGGRPARPRLI